MLAQACEQTRRVPADEPFLREAYVFGDLLEGADPIEAIEVAFVLNLPPEEVSWGSHPPGTAWLVDFLRLDKGGIAYWWRSHRDPVANHLIREPVRFWSPAGIEPGVLEALAERRFESAREQTAAVRRPPAQVEAELKTALDHLRSVHAAYWDRRWRREHRGLGRYPEHHLWEAVQGYLELLDEHAGRADHGERDEHAEHGERDERDGSDGRYERDGSGGSDKRDEG
ncbi:hypothetical protein GCM10009733_062330 [Nonomuraea maheshkhaliensis]|uniref:DUF7711 domain-containing protein n=2 Tax=Nonomuraea maheshkhaliensis TaxID=419590 RepID=A0ABP4RPD0_9ACTN